MFQFSCGLFEDARQTVNCKVSGFEFGILTENCAKENGAKNMATKIVLNCVLEWPFVEMCCVTTGQCGLVNSD